MLTHHRLPRRTARASSRGGFTLVELLVVIGIIAILAGVALGPITNGLRQARHNAAMQQSRQVGQLCFSYATDNTANGNRYPGGSAATDVVATLVSTGYATDKSIFYVSGQTGCTPSTSSTLAPTNVSWCFTEDAGNAGTGLANCGDSIPIVFFNNTASNSPVSFPASANSAVDSTSLATGAPQGTDGMALFYKGNNAVYIKSNTSNICPAVIPASNTDTVTYNVAD